MKNDTQKAHEGGESIENHEKYK